MPDTLVLKHITYSVRGFPVLRDINLMVTQGDIVLINGRSGHGKSSLLEICAGLLQPDSGDVLWDDVSVQSMSKTQIQDARFKMGFVFQLHALISNYSIVDNIALPIRCRKGYNDNAINGQVKQVMELFGLYGVDKLFPESLSCGQLKLASMARAFAGEPEMVFLDDPMSGCDPRTLGGILNVLGEYKRKQNITLIIISQDLTLFKEFSPKKYIIESGKLTPWTRDDNPNDEDFKDDDDTEHET
ncbi:MAG: ATP-binding cassette domain-containing protein [Fibrobacterota bacterium]|nr:ATP-binding cassette domain-containing protein [Chitinispirillaceae bacterium]